MNEKIVVGMVVIAVVVGLMGAIFLLQSEEILKVKKGATFSIVLPANPSTGYVWELTFNSTYIQLVDRNYEPYNETGLLGEGGEETFQFLAVASGKTEITFVYTKPGEDEAGDKRVFTVEIE